MIYHFAILLTRIYLKLFRRWKVTGRENIPPTGGFIFAANHTSYLDPPILSASISREVYFMSMQELFRVPLVAYLLRKLHAFSVKRGKVDRQALRYAQKLLKTGKIVIIFPEGGRSKDGMLRKAKPGMALLALNAGVPIVPAAITGASLGGFGKVNVKIGKPITFENIDAYNEKQHKETLDQIGEMVMAEIARLKES